jgi:cytochrome P450
MTRSPAEFGIDLMSGEFFGNDPYPAFAWMRRHAPVFHDDANDLWALARYDDVKAAGTDTATFSSAGGIRPKFPGLPMMIDLDAPEHVRRRKLVSAGFTPRRVQAMEAQVLELRGERIGEGAEIMLLYPSANRDDSVFDNADAFDTARAVNPHLAFGFGAHFCLGNQLARLELRVMFERLFARLPDLALAAPGPLPHRPSNFISGLESMAVRFTPARRIGSGH